MEETGSADGLCYVTVVFKSGERTSVWMRRPNLDELALNFVGDDNARDARRFYPTLVGMGDDSPPTVLVVTLQDIAYIT